MTEQRTVGFVGVAAAFPLELLAAVLAFLARDSPAGSGLGTFSSVWSVSGLALITGKPGATDDALGMFLIVAAIVLFLLIISGGAGRPVFGALMAVGCARLGLSGLYEIKATTGLEQAAGIAGLALGVVCAYGIVALLMEDLPRSALLPVGRSARADASVSGDLRAQLEGLENEPGVRRQL